MCSHDLWPIQCYKHTYSAVVNTFVLSLLYGDDDLNVRQDAVLAKQRPASVREVFAPKLSGAEQLAACSAGAPLSAGALFSSVAGLLGSSGQANYAAANAALDAWAGGQHAQVTLCPSQQRKELCLDRSHAFKKSKHMRYYACDSAAQSTSHASRPSGRARTPRWTHWQAGSVPRCACAVALPVSGSPDGLRSCGRRVAAGQACSPACLDDAQSCISTACQGVHAA